MSVCTWRRSSGTTYCRVSTVSRRGSPSDCATREPGPSAATSTRKPISVRWPPVRTVAVECATSTDSNDVSSRSVTLASAARLANALSNCARSIMIPGKSETSFSPDGRIVVMPVTCCWNTSDASAYLPIGSGTNSAHCTGTPISARRSTAITRAPAAAAVSAAQLPPGPSPTTRTSVCIRLMPPAPPAA